MPQYEYLSFSVKVLKFLNLWSSFDDDISYRRKFKDMSLILSILPQAVSCVLDCIFEIRGGAKNVPGIIENFVGISCALGMAYTIACFVKKRDIIRILVENIDQFQEFDDTPQLFETDNKANLYAKGFLAYAIAGNVFYMSMPYLNMNNCLEKKDPDDHHPCGMVTRCWYPFSFDYSPVFEMIFVYQFYCCSLVTVVVLVLTMLLCGILMHIINQLDRLRRIIKDLGTVPNEKLATAVMHCIKYHITIINYADATNEAFGPMLVLHLTLTSLVISGLGYEVLMVDDIGIALRNAFHLAGWLMLLFLICSYGQLLDNYSIAIAEEIYATLWFEWPVTVQKNVQMMLMRSQKPLMIAASSLGVMTLPTFVKVTYSAYSYFTLLLNLDQDNGF